MTESESALFDRATKVLDQFQIEIPSWGDLLGLLVPALASFFSLRPHPHSKRNSEMLRK